MLPINQVLCGDCIELMKRLPDGCIDMVMFSPPYQACPAGWGLRDYGKETETIWSEDPSCKHEWNISSRYWDNRHASVLAAEGKDKLGSRKDHRGNIEGSFCFTNDFSRKHFAQYIFYY